MSENLATLRAAALRLMLQEPFWGHLLAALPKQWRADGAFSGPIGLPDGRLALAFDQTYFERLPPAQQLGLLKHELLHLVLGHQQSAKPDALLQALAADAVAYRFVAEAQQPSDAPLAGRLPLRLPEDGGLERVYQALKQYAGQPEGRQALADMAERHAGHLAGWPSAGNAAASRLAGQQVRAALRRALPKLASERGQMPAELREALEAASAPQRPTLDWRQVLRRFVGTARRTQVRHTLRRPSRRYGSTPGTRIRARQRLLVVVDSSASMKAAMWQVFFQEIHALWRQGLEVDVAEADAKVQRRYAYAGTWPSELQGRGGTDFEAVLADLAHVRPAYDAVLYCTDGQAPAPGLRLPWPLLWVLPAGAKTGGELKGRVLRLG